MSPASDGAKGLVPVMGAKVRPPRDNSMPVERLDGLLDSVRDHRLALLIAPAGSGKSASLARLAARFPGSVGWYRAEPWDRDVESILRHMQASLAQTLRPGPKWQTVEQAVDALESLVAPVLVVIDDLHGLQGTDAERGLERLIEHAPAALSFAIGSRVQPGFNLPRWRVSGQVLEIGADHLRFRSWEVERLFRHHYHEPLAPEELAWLARRTDGWAAGLQLFHLATSGRPPEDRRQVLAGLGSSSRLVRDYLMRNMLEQLSPEIRRFVTDTAVLGRLSGPLCDRLLDRAESGEVLAELDRRSLFIQGHPDDATYRYHEVLRSHLLAILLEELGPIGMRERFREAARLLTAAGSLPEALEAYCRGDDWASARELARRMGDAPGTGSAPWLETLPASLLAHDPWLILASARHLRGQGRLSEAVEQYRRAEQAFGAVDGAQVARDERKALLVWLSSEPPDRGGDWSSVLRSAIEGEPRGAVRRARDMEGVEARISAGLALLVGAEASEARNRLLEVTSLHDIAALPATVASLGAGVAALLMGLARGRAEVIGAVSAAERLDADWLARVGRASLAIGGAQADLAEADAVADASAAVGDRWAQTLARLFSAWGRAVAGSDPDAVGQAGAELGHAPALAAMAKGLEALTLARAGRDPSDASARAEEMADASRVPIARLLGRLAIAEARSDAPAIDDMVRELADIGISVACRSTFEPAPAAAPALSKPSARLSLLGGLSIELGGSPLSLSAVRPRVRTLLRLLALHAGGGVHREVIEEALWPEAGQPAASHNLHVAVTALRRALEPDGTRRADSLVVRDGDVYRLRLPAGAVVDHLRLEELVAAGRAARARGAAEPAIEAFTQALELYRGELLPEEGPAEWALERREECRRLAVAASEALAELHSGRGNAAAAAEAAAAGLRADRYHDPLWRLLIESRELGGDRGAASRARADYRRVLDELGVSEAGAQPLAG